MPKVSKYAVLTQWLQQQNDTIRISFEQLNNVVELPNSAYTHKIVWANCSTSNATPFQKSWIEAGYKVSNLSLAERWVEFVKFGNARQIVVQPTQTETIRTDNSQPTQPLATSRVSQERLQAAFACGRASYDNICAVANHRYMSWEYCHAVFKANRIAPDEQTVDYLCLHLAWYLASWGMLRNSFLLQKDYKIHKEVVQIICQPQWNDLWDLSAERMAQEHYAKQVAQLGKLIFDKYTVLSGGNKPSDTLLTKILLGTVGCVPAYDEYFKMSLTAFNISPKKFCYRSVMALGNLYLQHEDSFVELQNHFSDRIDYPAAKVIDMCLFEYGFRLPKPRRTRRRTRR